jgi:two-component system response regulator (stage 0 sporulation protein F)
MIKLLTVDDEKGMTDLLYNFFHNRGFHVNVAHSGEEALKIVNSDRPDIIFLDISMKGMTGLEVLERVKRIDKNIKVIMVTVHSEKEMVTKAKELGADEYITKPFMVSYLEEVVIKKIQELMKEKKVEG